MPANAQASTGVPNAPEEKAKANDAPPTTADKRGDEKKVGVGMDAAVIVPIGEFSDATGPLLGGTLRLGYDVTPQFQTFVRGGLQYGLTVEGQELVPPTMSNPVNQTVAFARRTNVVPVYFGGRYFLMRPRSGLYGGAELGMNVLTSDASYAPQTVPGLRPVPPRTESKTTTRVGFNLGAGYVISNEVPLNIGVQIAYLNLLGAEEGEHTCIGVSAQVGYELRF